MILPHTAIDLVRKPTAAEGRWCVRNLGTSESVARRMVDEAGTTSWYLTGEAASSPLFRPSVAERTVDYLKGWLNP